MTWRNATGMSNIKLQSFSIHELTFRHVCTVWFWAKMPEWGFENPAYVWETQKGMQCFVKSTDCS
jgi:hypothetical protein